MKNSIKRFICLLLSGVIIIGLLSGCQTDEKVVIEDMEIEEVYNYSFDFIGGEDVMPIAGFLGPYAGSYAVDGVTLPNYISEEYYQMIADCGVNIINYTTTDYNSTPDLTRKMLELGEEYGVGLFVTDKVIDENRGENALSAHELGERISNYIDYSAFCGIYVADEPQWPGFCPGAGDRDISEFAPICQNLAELDIPAYLNLFPSYVNQEQFQDYPKYVEEALKTCNVPYIAYDHYVWDKGRDIKQYFYDMSVVRGLAEKYEIPFWPFIQAGSQWNDAALRFDSEGYYPDQGQFDWNINTCLAYGAKGILYFPLLQPVVFAYAESTDWDSERNALIGLWGNKNRWYYYAQDIQTQISAVDAVLMNSVSKGIIVSGEQAVKDSELSDCIMEGTSWRELTGVKGDALVGCFNYQGKTALYVVNYDYEYAQDITLEMYDDCKFTVTQDGKQENYKGNQVKLSMRAGEGALIVFE